MARTAQEYLNDFLPGKVIKHIEYRYPADVIEIFLLDNTVLTISVEQVGMGTRGVLGPDLVVEIDDTVIDTDDY